MYSSDDIFSLLSRARIAAVEQGKRFLADDLLALLEEHFDSEDED